MIPCKKCKFYDWERTNKKDLEGSKIGNVATATACWCKKKRQYMPFNAGCEDGKV